MKKNIIAILGLPGSGKTEVINYLKKKHNWPNVYFGEVTFEALKKEGLSLNNKNERIIRERIRRELGTDTYAKLSIPKVNKALKESNVVLVESLYSWEEYKMFKKKYGNSFQTIAIYSRPETRFKRLQKRKIRPIKTIKEFQKREYSQIENIDQGGPIAVADYSIINDKDLKTLHKKTNKIIKKIC